MQEQINSRSELWNMSIKDLFFKYVRFLPLFVISAALALFVAYIYLRYKTPIFGINASMMIKSENTNSSRDKFEDILEGGTNVKLQSEQEVLKSTPLMRRVVDSLELNTSYYAVGKFRSPNIYKQGPFLLEIGELFDSTRAFSLNIKFVSGGTKFRVNNSEALFPIGVFFKNEFGAFRLVKNLNISIGKEYNIIWQPSIAVAGTLSRGVVVKERYGTGILNLSMETTNSQMGADILNKLMEEYENASLDEKNKTAEQTLRFIDLSLSQINREIDSVENALLGYRQQHDIIDFSNQSYNYFQTLNQTDREIDKQRAYKDIAVMIDSYLKDKENIYKLVPSGLGIEDATLNQLVALYNEDQLKRKGYIDSKVPDGNPLIKEVEGQIEETRVKIRENLKNIIAVYNKSLSELTNRNNIVKSQVRELPSKNKVLVEISRQLEGKVALQKIFLENRVATQLKRASNIANSKIIDKAIAPTLPIKPNRRAIQILALMLGIGLPALFIFVLEVVNDKISTRFDIERITPAAVLGEVGHSYSETALVVAKTNRSMVAEQFRIIRSNLQYVLSKVEKSVIMVTSSFSGEGKSFISTNLGAVMALAGKKTVILEFDIRKPKILTGLGMSKKPGISNFLVGKGNVQDLIIPVPGHENLFVLPCGPVPPNPSELLLDEKVAELFTILKANFDVVLIDTAPVGMVSDAMTLSKFADATLYIVRQGYTFKKQVILIDEFYKENKLPKISIVINDVKMKPGYGYYGYGRYGYGYGYGQGYYEEEKKPARSFFGNIVKWLDLKRWKRMLFGRK